MRKIIAFTLLHLGICTAFSQNFNLIYIQLDYEMDYNLVNQKLDYLISNVLDEQDFVLLFTNSNPMKIVNKQNEIPEIRSQIKSNLNYDVQMSNVKSNLLKIISDKEIFQINNDNMILTNKYKNINFYCFVGKDFFENGFHDGVFATFLFSSDLQHNKDISFYYYNTSTPVLTLEEISFSKFYSNNSINIELK